MKFMNFVTSFNTSMNMKCKICPIFCIKTLSIPPHSKVNHI